MRTGTLRVLSMAALILAAAAGVATAAPSDAPLPPFMATTSFTSQPIGHFEFCQSHAAECSVTSATAVRVIITPARWNELLAINAKVNRAITPATDMEIYGREEWWTYPGDEGDCEDIALLKRRDLMEKG